jgi:hypothetical protein
MDKFNNEQGILSANQLLKNGEFKNIEIFDKAVEEIKMKRLKIINYKD